VPLPGRTATPTGPAGGSAQPNPSDAGFTPASPRPISRRIPPEASPIPLAKTSPLEFIQQVRTETRKVVWPTRRETVMTAVMVVIMTTVLALFFLGVDSFFNLVVQQLLKLAQ
jgi:preprotein translocase subunit SecE